jgi:hypothetical protein
MNRAKAASVPSLDTVHNSVQQGNLQVTIIDVEKITDNGIGKIILWDVMPSGSVEVHVSREMPASIFRVEEHVERETGGRFDCNSKTNACNLHLCHVFFHYLPHGQL